MSDILLFLLPFFSTGAAGLFIERRGIVFTETRGVGALVFAWFDPRLPARWIVLGFAPLTDRLGGVLTLEDARVGFG